MDAAIAEEWLQWMVEVHIPEVMQSNCFESYKILKLLTHAPDDNGVNYAIQYTAKAMKDYETYRDDFAPALQAKTLARYGDSVLAFRTLLEEIAGR
jgi:hypothetical protein